MCVVLTLECLVGTVVSILIGVGEQTEFPVGLLDLAVGACALHRLKPQDIVESGRVTFADSDNGGLLVDCECAAGAAVVVVVVAGFGVAIGVWICAACFGRHGCGGSIKFVVLVVCRLQWCWRGGAPGGG